MGSVVEGREAGDDGGESGRSGEREEGSRGGGSNDDVANVDDVQRDSGGGSRSAERFEAVAGGRRGAVGEAYKEGEGGVEGDEIDKRVWADRRYDVHVHA